MATSGETKQTEQFSPTKVTALGHALIAKVLAGKAKFNFSKVQAGDGRFDGDPTALTALVSPRIDGRIVDVREMGKFAELEGIFSNGRLTEFMEFREFGIIADDPDIGSILFAYSNAGDMPSPIGPFNGVWLHEERFVVRVFTANATDITATIVEAAFATEITFINNGTWLTSKTVHGAILELAKMTGSHVSETLADGVHGIKFEDGSLTVFDGENWKIISAEDDLKIHNTSNTAHENRFAQTMPKAPTGAIHGAIGGRWEALEGTELRAVTVVSEEVRFSFTDHYIDIPQDQFDRFEVFYPTVNGAIVRIEKNPMKQTLYAVGQDFEHYAFVYDGENMRIEVKRLGIAASNPNILHNWHFANPVNQRGLLEYAGAASYCLDRYWRTEGISMSIHDGFIRVARPLAASNPSIRQYIENGASLVGKQVTLSVIYRGENVKGFAANIGGMRLHYTPSTDWTLSSVTGIVGASAIWDEKHLRANVCSGLVNTGIDGASIDILAWKLELGTVSTLANDPPPDFGMELLKCQRYQLARWHSPLNPIAPIFSSRLVNTSSEQLMFVVPVPTTMRIHPSVPVAPVVRRLHGNAFETGFTFTYEAWSNAVRVIAYRASHGMTEAWLHFNADNPIIFDANL